MERRHPKRENYYIKIKVISFIMILDETKPLEIDRCKSKKEASVSEVLALFNCSSGGPFL